MGNYEDKLVNIGSYILLGLGVAFLTTTVLVASKKQNKLEIIIEEKPKIESKPNLVLEIATSTYQLELEK